MSVSESPFSFLRFISLSMSLPMLSSVTLAYICVLLMLECPIIFAMLSTQIPLLTSIVPKVWRA